MKKEKKLYSTKHKKKKMLMWNHEIDSPKYINLIQIMVFVLMSLLALLYKKN